MTTTPDAAAVQRLQQALEEHRGDDGAYKRLGAQLAARRVVISRRFSNRSLFARERLVPRGLGQAAAYKLADQVEHGFGQDRGGTKVGTMLIVAEAYEVSPDDIAAVLADPAAVFGAPRPPARDREVPVPDDGWMPPVGPGTADAVLAEADQVYAALRAWSVRYVFEHPGVTPGDVPEPSGAELFPDDAADAGLWDRRSYLPVEARVRLIAGLRAEESTARRRSGTG